MAETLRKMILDTGKPVATIAEDVGIPQPMLHRFVRGEQGLTLRTAEKLVVYFNLELRRR